MPREARDAACEGCEVSGRSHRRLRGGGGYQAHGITDMVETALRRGYRSRVVKVGAVEVRKTGREAAERACGFLEGQASISRPVWRPGTPR